LETIIYMASQRTMQTSEIKNLIAQGESESLELKKSLRSQNDALKTAAAFANADGGWILFGVKDNGDIVGVDIGSNTLENLANAFHRETDPIIYPTIQTVQIENETIIAVRIPAGSDKPYTLNGRAYKRVGRTTQTLSRSEYERLLFERHTNGYETLQAIGARWEDLDEAALEAYLAARAPRAAQTGIDLVEHAMTEKLALRTDEGVVPTIAGLLAFCETPQTINPSWGITALLFRGRDFDRNALVSRQEIDGSVAMLIENAAAFVLRNMRTHPVFERGKAKRKDIPEYDHDAVREAVANAVAHRDYRANEPIQLRLFDDRLEVTNPGPLPDDLTIEGILAGGVTRARNPVLAQVLLVSGYMERAGFGIVFIRQRMQALGAPAPEFESSRAHFLARLWAKPGPE
jgi:ATP-dependent DNA helicase RecG